MRAFQVIRRFFRLLTSEPMNHGIIKDLSRLLVSIFSVMTIYELFMLVETYPVRWFFDELSKPDRDYNKLLMVNGLILGAAVLANIIHSKLTIDRVRYFWRNWRLMWGHGHWHQLHLCTDWHTKNSTGEKESIVSKNVNKIERMIDDVTFDGVPMLARISVITSFVFFLNWYYGLTILAGVIVFTVILMRNERLNEPHNVAHRKEYKAIESAGMELVQNWADIKRLGLEDEFAGRNAQSLTSFYEREDKRFEFFMRGALKQDLTGSCTRFFLFLAVSALYLPSEGIGGIFVISGLSERIFSNLHRFIDLQRRLKDGLEGMDEYSDVLDTKPTVQERARPRCPRNLSGKLSFKNFTFTYPRTTNPALRNINISVPAGSSLALVGESGSGKTSLAKCLHRLYDPDSGQILLDNVDLREIHLPSLRRVISVVSQNFKLFSGTVEHNIDVGRGYSREEVIEAAKRAGAHKFIMEKGGYDAQIGEDGIQLSGGQRQRIAIAQALVSKPKILVLDEATSALDVETQAEVQRALQELMASGEVTVIIIAHRLSTVRAADQILVFRSGEIIESGNHFSLLKNPHSHYAHLCHQEMGTLAVA